MGISGTVFSRVTDPQSMTFPGGINTLIATHEPDSGHASLMMVSWVLPPKIGNVSPVIRFIFDSGPSIDRTNTSLLPLVEHIDDAKFDSGFNNKYVTKVELRGNNSGPTETQDLGAFTLFGYQGAAAIDILRKVHDPASMSFPVGETSL